MWVRQMACLVLCFMLIVENYGEHVRNARRVKESVTNANQKSGRKLRDASSSKEQTSSLKELPFIDFQMTLPPKEDGGDFDDHDVEEMNLELRFDNDTPPSKITIKNPNITWKGNETHTITIRPDSMNLKNSEDDNSDESPAQRTELMEASASFSQHSQCSCPDVDEIIGAIMQANVLKGMKGDRGSPGTNGFPGLSIQGQKGEPGDPPPFPHCPGQGAFRGENGCVEKQSGSGVWPPTTKPTLGVPSEQLYRIVPGALVFPNKQALLQMQQHSFVGTVAFVESEEAFYGRVKSGWRSFNMGQRAHKPLPYHQTLPPITERPKPSPRPFQPPVILEAQKPPEQLIEKDSQTKAHAKRTSTPHHHNVSKSRISSRSHLIDSLPLGMTRIITLNSPLSGNMGGFNQVNYQCQRQAMKANLNGVFRALHLFPYDKDSRLLNTIFVNSKNESFRSSSQGKLYSFNGKEVDIKNKRWILASGLQKQDCRGWTSDNLVDQGLSAPIVNFLSNLMEVSEIAADSCQSKHFVLCVEFLHMSQIHVRHRNGKHRLSFDKYLAVLKAYDDSID